jgi:cytochrome P450
MGLPPGPRSPAIVQTLRYARDPERFITDCHRKYGDVFSIETVIFGKEVAITRPELIKTVFTGDPEDLRAGEANEALSPVLGTKSVLLLDGAEHLRQRRLMLPPFHGERMLAYAKTMRDVTHRRIDAWPREIVIHPEMQAITLDVILRTVFGADEGDELEGLRRTIAGLLDLVSSPWTMLATVPAMRRELRGLSPWAYFLRKRKKVDDRIYAVIAKRRQSQERRSDILSLLLDAKDENGDGMTDVELRDELMTLLVAGHETTANELAWTFELLLRHPRAMKRVMEEIGGFGGEPNIEKLPYVDAVIKEVLRLRPVVPAVGRKLKRPMKVGAFEVPAGTLLVPSVWLTHRLPDVYPDPERFDPERFLDKKPDPYAWLPFGGGIRRCIGMAFALFEMRVVLATVLSRVRMQLVMKRPARVVLRAFTHAPEKGVPVVVTERKRQRSDMLRDGCGESASPA